MLTDFASDLKLGGAKGYWLRNPGNYPNVCNMREGCLSADAYIQNLCGIRPAIKLYELPEGTRFITDEEYTQEHVSYYSQNMIHL